MPNHKLEFGESSLYPSPPSPRKAHSRRESNEESPGRRVSLAQSGAAAVRLPHSASAYSRRYPIDSADHSERSAHPTRRFFSYKRTSVALRLGSSKVNAQTRSEPIKPDNRMTTENVLSAIPTHGGIETKHPASRPVWRYAAKSRRDRTQNTPTEPHDRRVLPTESCLSTRSARITA